MAKKYKFKLEALLKIRRIREEQCKMEIGRIQIEMESVKKKINEQSSGISEAYELQERSLSDGATGLEARFYPYFVEAKRSHINQLDENLRELKERSDKMYRVLAKFRSDVKLIEQMKDKDKISYKKMAEKKMYQEIEEQVQNWKQIVKT